MADKQISDLTSASSLTDGSLFVLEQGGAAKKANWGMMKNYLSPGIAPQYSTSSTYAVGDYVIHNDQLYRCTTPITTAETWTAAHWTAAVLGDDVSDLKSALGYVDIKWVEDKCINANGVETTWNNYYSCTDYICLCSTKIHVVTRIHNVDFPAIAFYDEAKQFISPCVNPTDSSTFTFDKVVTVPDGAFYARINCLKSDVSQYFQFDVVGITDYLSGKLANYISDISTDIKEYGNINDQIMFTLGKAWYGSVGSVAQLITGYQYRLANETPILLKSGKYKITVKSGYRISYRILDSENIILFDSGWITSNATFIANGTQYYAFSGGGSTDGAITKDQYLENVAVYMDIEYCKEEYVLPKQEVLLFSSSWNIKSVNHRGFNTVAPENTLPAFKLSRENGFKYVETDVRFTSDGIPVLLHDQTINRTARNADGTEISNTLWINDLTFTQVREYDFGIWKSSQYAGTKIPSLAEFMNLCRNIGLTPRVELNVLTVANAVTMFNVINSYGMSRKVEYNCNDLDVAQKFLELEPTATIVYGMSSYDASTVDAVCALKTINNTIIINMYYTEVDSTLIDKCKEAGVELEVWTVNSDTVIKALDPYVSGVTSDNINASVIMYNADIN